MVNLGLSDGLEKHRRAVSGTLREIAGGTSGRRLQVTDLKGFTYLNWINQMG